MDKKTAAWLNLVLLIIVILINYVTAAGILPGLSSQKEVSALYQTPITPAGFAFSIWGVIYLLLFAAIVYMIKTASDENPQSEAIHLISRSLRGMFLFNVLWNIVFGKALIGLSVLMILAYWVSLILIGFRLSRVKIRKSPVFLFAFGLHTGWITIASIVNLYAFLVKLGWETMELHRGAWTLVGVIAAVFLAWLLQRFLKNPTLPLGTAWALLGIYAREDVSAAGLSPLSVLLLAGIAALALSAGIGFWEGWKERSVKR